MVRHFLDLADVDHTRPECHYSNLALTVPSDTSFEQVGYTGKTLSDVVRNRTFNTHFHTTNTLLNNLLLLLVRSTTGVEGTHG